MDWQQLINQFKPITVNSVEAFASSRDMEQAVFSFNRAISNLKSQNGDVAQISLRKLTATYPTFSLATLLLGLSQANFDHFEEARTSIRQAVSQGLAEPYSEIASTALDALDLLLEPQRIQNQNKANARRLEAERAAAAAAQSKSSRVLEKTSRRNNVRMASSKERQDVIRRGENANQPETNVAMKRDPIEYLRLGVPILGGIIVLGLLIFFGITLFNSIADTNQRHQEDEARLAWLTARLDSLADDNTAISALLEEYEAAFAPTPATPVTDPSQTTVETTPETTAPTPTPSETTVETTVDPALALLVQASDLYNQAATVASSDILSAGDKLVAARTLLATIPGTTTAPAVTGDAASLSASVESLIGQIGVNAAEKNRKLGMTQFGAKQYAAALSYFLTAYQLHPTAYGGGVAYYCGRCYQLLADNANAKGYYDFVVAQFPTREIAANAKSRLNEMGY